MTSESKPCGLAQTLPGTGTPTAVAAPTALEAPTASSAQDLEAFLPRPAITMPSGRTVYAGSEPGGERLDVRAVDGTLELSILLTDRGPVLRMNALAVEVRADRLALAGGEVRVEAERRLEIRSEGELVETVRGRRASTVLGRSSSQAREHDIVAARGEVRVQAHEDVRVNGANVLLNC